MVVSIKSYSFINETNTIYRPMLIGSTSKFNSTYNPLKVYYIKEMTSIIKEIFSDYWVESNNDGEMPGFFNFGGVEGRSVLNFFNTHYGIFCKLVNDINYVMSIEFKDKPYTPLSFHNKKNDTERLEEMKRYFSFLRHYSNRIFSIGSKTFSDLIALATRTTEMGKDTEDRTIKIINETFQRKICKNTAGSGMKIDAYDKIDALITLDGDERTAQIKPYSMYQLNENNFTFLGTGDAESYKTNLLIFNRENVVFIFENKNVEVINNNFVLPIESLIKSIGISFNFQCELI